MCMGGGSRRSNPPPEPPPTLPEAPRAPQDPRAMNRGSAANRRQNARFGGTILTSPQGVTQGAATSEKTLLGS